MLEKFFAGLYMSAVGFAIVFSVLLLLACIVSIIKRLDDYWQDKEEKEKEKAFSKMQTIDNTTLVLISAAVATYFKGRMRVRRVRVLPDIARSGGSWASQTRTVLQGSHIPRK